MQGIFLSFYFLRILVFYPLQSKYVVAAVRGNYSNLDIFHCLPVPSASRESRLEGREAYICKSMGGACKGTDKDAVEKRPGKEYRVTLSIHPGQFQFYYGTVVYFIVIW